MPELAKQVALGVADTAIAEADHVAVLKADEVAFEKVLGEIYEIPPEADRVLFVVDRRGFPPLAERTEFVLEAEIELSFDKGETWPERRAFSTKNGPIYAPLFDENGRVVGRGEEVFESMMDASLPRAGEEGRLMRVSLTPFKDVRAGVTCKFYSSKGGI